MKKQKDDIVFVQDDRLHIPKRLMEMSMEELDNHIKQLEESHMSKREVALRIG